MTHNHKHLYAKQSQCSLKELFMSTESGLTFIELIIAIIIIALIAIIAIPKLTSLSNTAEQAATTAVASALTAVNANNYGIRSMNKNAGMRISNCTDVIKLLQGTLPKNYSVKAAAVTRGDSVVCTINGPSNTKATFTASGIN
jgi:competence protein ComGC